MNQFRAYQLTWNISQQTRKTLIIIPKVGWQWIRSIGNLLNLIINNDRLFWSLNLIDSRLKYKFDALYWGIKLNQEEKNNLHNFRRNIHRLEKGLSYPSIKNVFAEDYILETVVFLRENEKKATFDENTKSWGIAILNLYFEVCDHTEKISEAYNLFQTLSLRNKHSNWIPYKSKNRPELLINYRDLYQLALRRRSIRYYLDQPVEPCLIQEAMKIAALSPSACNRQSFKFLFFNQRNLVYEISQIPGGVGGYELPSLIIVIGRYAGYFDVRDINTPIIDASLASMAFILTLETLGLSSVCINWPNLPDREEKIRQLIHLERDEFVVMLIGVGYPEPNGKIPYSAKKDLNKILCINQRINS
ncbi:nitroreductase family protein [Myxosarcina sp. GI1(2024)]